MAEHFRAYSAYYDLLYADKDYAAETRYIQSLLQKFGPGTQTILELGSGTGRHAELLAETGFSIEGVELSDSMLTIANQRRLAASQAECEGSMQFHAGDARSYRSKKTYDAVISLFHVLSYQTTNADCAAVFETVAQHLKPNGIFVFDVWYGPAVLTDRPSVRVKRMAGESCQVIRIAEPSTNVNQNRVDVRYTMIVTDEETGQVSQFEEKHPMRYYFPLELDLFADSRPACASFTAKNGCPDQYHHRALGVLSLWRPNLSRIAH